jgi:hydroxymethylglutaryl-CoA lyase
MVQHEKCGLTRVTVFGGRININDPMNKLSEQLKNLPASVTLIEVGPRDGFQFESKVIPTRLKAEIISAFVDAGIKAIQVTSFVNPGKIPQMADAEKLIHLLPDIKDVEYSALVLNLKGVERALAAGMKSIEISISASDTHSRKNTGMTFGQAHTQAHEMIKFAQKHHMKIRAGVQCAFGCVYEGEIPRERVLKIFQGYVDMGVHTLALSDTTGMANPRSVIEIMEVLKPATKNSPVALHLHDTRGLGLANVIAALSCGITRFDTALGGMGGCPFVSGAAGNVATEDVIYMLESMGIQTCIDGRKVAQCSVKMADFFKKTFQGKLYRLGG